MFKKTRSKILLHKLKNLEIVNINDKEYYIASKFCEVTGIEMPYGKVHRHDNVYQGGKYIFFITIKDAKELILE